MSATPSLKNLAERLLKYEAVPQIRGDETAAFRVCEKLRLSLSRLAGTAGFRALLARALALANAEVSWLKAVHLNAEGSIAGLGAAASRHSREEVAEGEIVLVAQLLTLLCTFIGDALTLRMVQDAWPTTNLDDVSFDKGKNS